MHLPPAFKSISPTYTIYNIHITYRVTHTGSDFRDDFTEFIMSVSFITPCSNHKLLSFLAKTLNKPFKDYIDLRLNFTLGL